LHRFRWGITNRPLPGGCPLSQQSFAMEQGMSNSERDYSDYRNTPFHEHGDQVPSNRSTNLTMYDVIDARTSRRDFLVGGLTALATGLFGAGLAPRAALAQTTAASGLLGFKPVALSKEDTAVVPERY
jgi:uncharacterized protein